MVQGVDLSVLKSNDYIATKSDCSFNIKDLKSFIYGGISSRFWMMRKHINQMTLLSDLNKLSFYSWDCVTL